MLVKDYNIKTYDMVTQPSNPRSVLSGKSMGLINDKIDHLLNITIWKINRYRRNQKINRIINE